MSRNGVGTFVIGATGNPVSDGQTITSSLWNTTMTELAAGVNSGIQWLTSVSGTDTISGTALGGGVTSYYDGLMVCFKTQGANTTNVVTLNVNGLGPISLRYGTGQITAGDLTSQYVVIATYNSISNRFIINTGFLGLSYVPLNGVVANDNYNKLSGLPLDSSSSLATTAQLTVRAAALPRVVAYRAASLTTAGTVFYDTLIGSQVGTGYNTGTGVFTCATAGLYHISASVAMQNSSGGSILSGLALALTGFSATANPAQIYPLPNGGLQYYSLSFPVYMAAGDTAKILSAGTSATNIIVGGGNSILSIYCKDAF